MSQRMRDVISTELRWTKAHLDLDMKVIEEILSDDFQRVDAHGEITGKADLLRSYRSGTRKWEIAESTDHEVRLIGNTAVLFGRWRGKGLNGNKLFDYAAQFVTVYILENEKWRILFETSEKLFND